MSYTFTEIDYRKHNSSDSLCHTLSQKQTRKHNSSVSLCHAISQKQTIENTIVVSVYVNQSHRNRLENTIVVSVYVNQTHRNRLQKTQQQCQFMSCNLTKIDYRKHNSSVSLCHTLSQKQIIKIHQLTQLMSNFHRNRLENKKYVQG